VLFGQDAFQYGLRSIWFYLRPQDRGHPSYFEPDGYQVSPEGEERMRAGTFRYAEAAMRQAKKFKRLASDSFDALSSSRVQLFQDIVRSAHARGVMIEVFVPPMSPVLTKARSYSQLPQRAAELDLLLAGLEREGLLRYHRLAEVEDLGDDPTGFFDGVHMTETTSTRVLLRLFHREHGCGL
jgi:hypothetical protein